MPHIYDDNLLTFKWGIFFFIILLFLLACNSNNRRGVDICHFNKKTGTWQKKNIDSVKIKKHFDHGDFLADECEQYTYIEDAMFEQFLYDLKYDDAIDNRIINSKIDSVTRLNINGKRYQKIKNINGIEAFKNLQVLSCENNDLEELDLSKNVNLRELYCYNNKITKLNFSQNINLEILFCGSNKLSDLNVSENINLKELHCYNNQLKSLDVSNNTNLEKLWIQVNQLNNLDLTKNQNLTTLHCNHNQLLQNLDLINNSNLEFLYCHNNSLISLDVSNNPKLKTLHCNDNKLKRLNLKNVNSSLIIGSEFRSFNNPLLNCILVDSIILADKSWRYIDKTTRFSDSCY